MNDILSLEKAAMERWRNGDPLGFVELSAQDIIYVDPGLSRPIASLEAYTAYMKEIEGKVHYQASEFIEPKVVTIGDAALLSYNYRSTVLSPAGEIIRQTPWNTTEVYFRRDGEWKIVHSHWSFIHHKLPERIEVPVPMQFPPQEYEGLLGEIMALESAAMERWRKGDPWGFIDLYASDVTYFDPGTPQRFNGLEALRAEYAQAAGKIHFEVMEFIQPRIRVLGDMLVLTYRFFSTHLKENGAVASRTPWNCTEVYARLEGRWQIIHNHWSLINGVRSSE